MLYKTTPADGAQIVPAVNQIELHPGYPSPQLVALNTSKGIYTTGYSCLGSQDSPFYKDATLLRLADAKGRTPQQVLLMWGLQKGWSVIPKSVTPARIEANFQLDGVGADRRRGQGRGRHLGGAWRVQGVRRRLAAAWRL